MKPPAAPGWIRRHCAYVGDNLNRDVTGTRAAGFGMVIIMISPEELAEATITPENRPDLIINNFRQLLDIYPDRKHDPVRKERIAYVYPIQIQSAPIAIEFTSGAMALARGVQELYSLGQSDYSLEPIVLADAQGNPVGRIHDGDAVVFCLRRGEREIELTEAFTEPGFDRFPRPDFKNLPFAILTLYHDKFKDLPVAFLPSQIKDTLSEVVSRAGLRQLHTAESEKFAHVTFFFNGGNRTPFPGEEDVRIPSPKGLPFDQVPQLSLEQVTRPGARWYGGSRGFDCNQFCQWGCDRAYLQ